MEKFVIVGGVAGGASAAARLRRLREDAQIVILERGPHISFANCGLPYYVGGVIPDEDDLLIQTPESFRRRFRVEVRVRSEVTALHPAEKRVTVRNLETGEEYFESYDKLILATGAEPLRPPVPGVDLPHVRTLRTVEDARELRALARGIRNAAVVGAGFVGLEAAENLRRLGPGVTVIEASDRVLPAYDAEIALMARRVLRAGGIELRLGCRLSEITPHAVRTDRGEEIPAELTVLAVGVRPESRLAADCGLTLGERGAVVTDEFLRTSDPNIYAVGDLIQTARRVDGAPAHMPLAGPANRQGRLAADRICGLGRAYGGSLGTSVIKLFGHTFGRTGLSEEQARAVSPDAEAVLISGLSHAGYYPGAEELALKVIFRRGDGKLLGACAAGKEGVDKRLDVLATALWAGLSVRDLADLELAYAPPYSSAKDPVNMAGFAASNLLDGLCENARWTEPETANPAAATLLDVRTEPEVRRGRVPGALWIPLDEMRERFEEIPRDKPVLIFCHSGLRSYLACRILSAKGYRCRNLLGGYRLYDLLQSQNAND